jgi:cell division protein FtsI (penicillin-binding protein 3)
MAKPLRKKARNKNRFHAAILLIILLAAAGAVLHRLPPSLLDIGRIIRLAADKFSAPSADFTSAEAVLRGTVFDRNLHELAVSYRLYSLYVRPSELADRHGAVSALARITGMDEGELEVRLRNGGAMIKIAEHLDREQADAIDGLQLAGVYSRPVEERYYPEHEVAADLLGYTGEGAGLAGIESSCDTVLQEGEFRAASIPEIDFKGKQVLGNSGLDVVLTLDLEIQKQVEHRLREYLRDNAASRGAALVLHARTGALLAWAALPAFNPNYFWQLPGEERVDIAGKQLDGRLYRDLLLRAAATWKMDIPGTVLLPEFIAAPDYGLQENEIHRFAGILGLGEDLRPGCGGNLPVVAGDPAGPGKIVTPLQVAAAAAGMLNGGWKVQPYVLDVIYDGTTGQRYARSGQHDAAARKRIISPAMGIMMRMNLSGKRKIGDEEIFLYTGSVADTVPEGRFSRYIMQELLVGAVPARSPEFVLLVAAWRDHLLPTHAGAVKGRKDLAALGAAILPELSNLAAWKDPGDFPAVHNAANYNRFLISRRIDYQEKELVAERGGQVMPLVTGLSLRKGLQRLNPYNLKVRVEGSGRIVTQRPESGEPLEGVGECTLILESNI